MRFAHLSDTHLGHRQYGIFEREQDFYELFDKTIDKIIELDVDFVVHSGDLFDYSRPSTDALLSFQDGLIKLNKAGIPVYAIAGNHDSILRKDVKPPLTLFKQLGLNLITLEDNYYEFGDVFIGGVPYVPKSQKNILEESFIELSEISKNYSKSILVLHQGIKKLLPMDSELECSDLPDNFDYYALGHLHDYHRKEWGRGYLVYPGSMELFNYTDNYAKFGKGFCVVDLSGDELEIERISVEIERKLFDEKIDYPELEEKLHELKNEILKMDKKPMVDITVIGGDAESAEIYDILQNEFKGHVLNLKYNYIPESKIEGGIIEGGSLDVKKMLYEKVNEKYEDEDVSKLSVDIFEKLAANEIEDAKIISDSYFKEHYDTSKENDNESDEGSSIDDNEPIKSSLDADNKSDEGSFIEDNEAIKSSFVDDNERDKEDKKPIKGSLDDFF